MWAMLMGDAARVALPDVSVRPLREDDLPVADRVFRLAFSTFLGLPDPQAFLGDVDTVRARWRAEHVSAFGAEIDGELVGSVFVTNWGSLGFFGGLTIRPDLWDRGLASHLMAPTMACFATWGTRHAGLLTFADSPKHVHLYQKFGFWPRSLTAVLSKPVPAAPPTTEWVSYATLPEGNRSESIRAAKELTNGLLDGLDVTGEIRAVHAQNLGDTILVWDGAGLTGFAVCHCGPGTEAGSGVCYVKFGAVRPGPKAADDFDRLLDACEGVAASQGVSRLVAGCNMAREAAYRALLARGFRADLLGVAMHRPNEPGHSRPNLYIIDDWR
jgi:GNAT superfamily N-acetyltransferase